MSETTVAFLFDDDASQYLERGCDFMRQNRFAEAITEFEDVLKLEPKNRHARWNRAVALLSLGDYIRGMPEHESAWELYDWRALGQVKGNVDRIFALPLWRGEWCRLIVYHEMGFGDAIMLLRFLPDLVSSCESVTLVVRPELVSLMQGRGATIVGSIPQDMSLYEKRVTFFNAVHTMGYSLKTIPKRPYIFPKFWEYGWKQKIGIAWSGSSRKEFTLDSFLSMLDVGDREIYALQLVDMEESTGRIERIVYPLRSKDFRETVDLIARMDHVATVDTAAAHLAGAMGHPSVHLILPFMRDWRWHHADVWYPTIKIYPQPTPEDWATPFARLNEALK